MLWSISRLGFYNYTLAYLPYKLNYSNTNKSSAYLSKWYAVFCLDTACDVHSYSTAHDNKNQPQQAFLKYINK